MENTVNVIKKSPLGWSNGNFPIINYLIDKSDNPWYKNLDNIYSLFKMNDKFYASGVKWSKSSMGFAMAFGNDGSVPVKNGFESGEKLYWGVMRDDGIHELILSSTYAGKLDTNAIFEFKEDIIEVLDNPYYSLDPIWPTLTEVMIDVPITTKALTFSQLKFKGTITPRWTTGYFTPELSETNAVLRLAKSKEGVKLNACTIRFRKADVEKGYFYLTIKSTPLKNSTSTELEKTYKIYWEN